MKGTTKTYSLRIPTWIDEEIVGEVDNRTIRVNELLIKGWEYEKMMESKKNKSPLYQYIYPDNMRDSRIKAFIGEQCSVLA